MEWVFGLVTEVDAWIERLVTANREREAVRLAFLHKQPPLRWTTIHGPTLPDRPPAAKARFGDLSGGDESVISRRCHLPITSPCLMLAFAWETLFTHSSRSDTLTVYSVTT
jgi:hypothetical protein